MKHIQVIVEKLKKQYPTLPMRDLTQGHPWKTLVATILSQRARDDTIIPLSRKLFETVGDTPQDFLKIDIKELEKIIFQSGCYHQKAKNIQACAKILIEKYNNKMPDTIEELTAMPGVGRKTANIVLSHCFEKPAIAVDTHVHRISNLIGWINTKTPEKTEQALMKVIPQKYWTTLNDLLVRHGQEICKPQNPQCHRCPILPYCEYGKKRIFGNP